MSFEGEWNMKFNETNLYEKSLAVHLCYASPRSLKIFYSDKMFAVNTFMAKAKHEFGSIQIYEYVSKVESMVHFLLVDWQLLNLYFWWELVLVGFYSVWRIDEWQREFNNFAQFILYTLTSYVVTVVTYNNSCDLLILIQIPYVTKSAKQYIDLLAYVRVIWSLI